MRLKASVLKQTNRTAYYVGKWVLIGGLLAALFSDAKAGASPFARQLQDFVAVERAVC